jgi:hypothetical protein
MVHHFCIMRPIRSFFGLMLLTGAIVCFYRAMEHSRYDFAGTSTSSQRPARQWYAPATAETVVARKVPAIDKPPLPSPPQPSSDRKTPPDWLGKPPHLESREGPGGPEVFVATATAGPYSTPEECDRALGAEIDRVVTDFAERQFQPAPDQPLKLDREVQEHLIQDRYRETVESPTVGEMQEEHVLLVFDNQVRAAIEQVWRSIMIVQRLAYAAAASVAVLLALGVVYLLLKWKPAAASRS